jgi:hypothetical protein
MRWIKVTTRLPKGNGIYIVHSPDYLFDPFIPLLDRDRSVGPASFKEGKFYREDKSPVDVCCWMVWPKARPMVIEYDKKESCVMRKI